MTLSGSVLLLGNYRPTLPVATALARLGHRVIVTRGGGGTAHLSRHVAEVWHHPEPMDGPAFLSALAEFLEARPDIRIVVPLAETCVVAVARNRDRLPADRLWATPADHVVLTCHDKIRMLDVAAEAGVPSARAEVVESQSALQDAAGRIGFPLIVRPLTSARPIAGGKALIAPDRARFAAAMARWPDGHDSLIVQRYVDGARINVDFAASRGRPIRMVTTRVIRTDAHDGTGIEVFGRTIPLPEDIGGHVARMLARLDYTGVGLIQFMVDRARGETTFVELNPRFNGNTSVGEKAGMELARLAVDLAADPDRAEETRVAPGGLTHAWTFGDLRGIRFSLKRGMPAGQLPGALGACLWNALRADHHIMWRRADPLPALGQFAQGLGLGLRRDRSGAAGGMPAKAP